MRAIKLFYGSDLAVRKAFEAGNDIIVFRFNKDEEQRVLNNIVQLVESGKIKENRIDRSVNRIIEIKEKYDISDKQNFEGVNVDKINEKIIDIRKNVILKTHRYIFYVLFFVYLQFYIKYAIINSSMANGHS